MHNNVETRLQWVQIWCGDCPMPGKVCLSAQLKGPARSLYPKLLSLMPGSRCGELTNKLHQFETRTGIEPSTSWSSGGHLNHKANLIGMLLKIWVLRSKLQMPRSGRGGKRKASQQICPGRQFSSTCYENSTSKQFCQKLSARLSVTFINTFQ